MKSDAALASLKALVVTDLSVTETKRAQPQSGRGWSYAVPPAPDVSHSHDGAEVVEWLVQATSVLKLLFPPEHPTLENWQATVPATHANTDIGTIKRAKGILRAAVKLIESGGLTPVHDAIRAETVSEVLDQADDLADSGYLAAASVLAGGALETHLRHLCERANLTWQGSGSIEKYTGAVDQVRKPGSEVFSKSDSKQVRAWGGLRNDAAHDPGKFAREVRQEQVRLMVDGVRQFVTRTT